MFEKNLTKPIILEQHEALLRRLDESHPKMPKVESKLGRLKAGYNGEKTINYFLGLLPSNNYHIFHRIRLSAEQGFFEADHYLLSPKFSLIIEGKNYSGILHVEKNQLTQEINDEKKVYENPLVQVNRHKILLKYWFEKNQLPIIPTEHLVCVSNTSSIINIDPGYLEAEKRVCKAVDLLRKIIEFEQIYKKDLIDQETIEKIRMLILAKDTLLQIDLLKKYEIDKREIRPGVQCPKCNYLPMQYNRGKWECPDCHFFSRDAHLQAINDYFLLYGNSITNSELKDFLHLPTSRAATNMFTHLHLSFVGKTKDRAYFLALQNPLQICQRIPNNSNHVFPY